MLQKLTYYHFLRSRGNRHIDCLGDYYTMKWELLGELKNKDEEVIQQIFAPFDGVLLYHTHILGIKKDQDLMAYGEIIVKNEKQL